MAADFASASEARARKRPSSTPDGSTGSLNRTEIPGASGGTPSPSGATDITRGAGSGSAGLQAASAAAARTDASFFTVSSFRREVPR